MENLPSLGLWHCKVHPLAENKKVWNIFWYLATAANDLKDSKRGAKGNQEKRCFVQVCECVVVQGSECLIAVRQTVTFYSSNRFVSAHGWSSGLRHGLALGSGVVRAPNSLAQTIYRATTHEMMCTGIVIRLLTNERNMPLKTSVNAPHHHIIHQNYLKILLRVWEGHQKQNMTITENLDLEGHQSRL